jgi:hypothetical protein
MAEPRDTSIPDEPQPRVPAEGSREANTDEESGISNRPIEEDQRDQQGLPRRGNRKDGTHA